MNLNVVSTVFKESEFKVKLFLFFLLLIITQSKSNEIQYGTIIKFGDDSNRLFRQGELFNSSYVSNLFLFFHFFQDGELILSEYDAVKGLIEGLTTDVNGEIIAMRRYSNAGFFESRMIRLSRNGITKDNLGDTGCYSSLNFIFARFLTNMNVKKENRFMYFQNCNNCSRYRNLVIRKSGNDYESEYLDLNEEEPLGVLYHQKKDVVIILSMEVDSTDVWYMLKEYLYNNKKKLVFNRTLIKLMNDQIISFAMDENYLYFSHSGGKKVDVLDLDSLNVRPTKLNEIQCYLLVHDDMLLCFSPSNTYVDGYNLPLKINMSSDGIGKDRWRSFSHLVKAVKNVYSIDNFVTFHECAIGKCTLYKVDNPGSEEVNFLLYVFFGIGGISIPLSICCVLMICICGCCCCLIRRKLNVKRVKNIINGVRNIEDVEVLLAEQNTVKDVTQPSFDVLDKCLIFEYSEISIVKSIGKGRFSEVFLCNWKGSKCVLKKYSESSVTKESGDFEREVNLIASLSYPGIVRFIGVCSLPNTSILMEFCGNGNIKEFLLMKREEGEEIQLEKRISFLIDVSKAISFLHSKNIWHRDLRSTCVLIDDNLVAKVGGFGMSKLIDSTALTTLGGVDGYAAPELRKGGSYTDKIDVYAFGVICLEVYTHDFEFVKDVNDKRSRFVENIKEDWFKEIVVNCLREESEERKSFQEITKMFEENVKDEN